MVSSYLQSGLATKTNDGEDRAADQGSGYEPGQPPQQDALGPFAEKPSNDHPNNQEHSDGGCLVKVVLLSNIGDASYLVSQQVVGGVSSGTAGRRGLLVISAASASVRQKFRRKRFIHRLDVVIQISVLGPIICVITLVP